MEACDLASAAMNIPDTVPLLQTPKVLRKVNIQQQRRGTFRLTAAFTALSVGLFSGTSLGQDDVIVETLQTQRDTELIFAVGGPARKALPPLDCLRCWGPAACPPCEGHRPGFLYFGTCAAHDDPLNGFCDCSQSHCGHFAAGLSTAWIRFRSCFNVKSWLRDACGGACSECCNGCDR